jgi:hypothetical protein
MQITDKQGWLVEFTSKIGDLFLQPGRLDGGHLSVNSLQRSTVTTFINTRG